MVTNALVIAFTSDFIDRVVYLFYYAGSNEQNIGDTIEFTYFNGTTEAAKYAAYIFSIFNTSDYPTNLDFDLRRMQVFHAFSILSIYFLHAFRKSLGEKQAIRCIMFAWSVRFRAIFSDVYIIQIHYLTASGQQLGIRSVNWNSLHEVSFCLDPTPIIILLKFVFIVGFIIRQAKSSTNAR